MCCFSAKSDRCTGRARRSDGPRCCNRASIKFNVFARCIFLRLPRSYRVAEKSSQIVSREPNCAVFQQITTVVQAPLDAPMDSDAVIAAACNSVHVSVTEKPDPIAHFSGPGRRKSWKNGCFYRISRRRDTVEPNGEKHV